MSATQGYFPYSIQICRRGWTLLDRVGLTVSPQEGEPLIVVARRIARALQETLPAGAPAPRGGELNLYALLNRAMRHVLTRYATEQNPGVLIRGSEAAGFPVATPPFLSQTTAFGWHYPPRVVGTPPDAAPEKAPDADPFLVEALILRLTSDNEALLPFAPLYDDRDLAAAVPSRELAAGVERYLEEEAPVGATRLSLPALLRGPLRASPRSLAGQIEFIREHWQELLPPELLTDLVVALDVVRVEEREFAGGPGRPQVLEFLKGGRLGREGYEYPEYERFSADADWMANVVMIAKMTYVWLDQLSRRYGRQVSRLDEVPDEELDRLATWGFSALWLIGVWERSPASQRIKQISGNPDAISSAYSLYDYTVAHDLGGEGALENLKERCRSRGIRLASDMVPNHTGIFSRWTVEHPDWFIQLDYPPYPAYSFRGPDLSSSPEISLHIEDGYWDRRDAAVVFKHYDHRDGRTRYIYHGNDGTSTPWNDTAQLNYLLPQVREAVINTILHVARQFPIIRFDAAMTLAKKHYQRLWFPQPGHGSGVPSRAEQGMSREEFDRAFPEEFWREVVDRVAAEAPGTLLLAEAFWLMEGYFVRTLGMHRVYNSAFMNMLKMEENAKYRQTVKNVLEFDPEILKRFVNFMNNPDERTAIEQFGREGKYFGACVLLVTMPGLPMFGHGQVEGFHEKYGMEYRRAYWEEPVDEHLVSLHERLIFPLVRRRRLFSGSRDFVFYDFFAAGHVNEDVFAYSNRDGEERGVIIFHNRFASTAGWVRTSTARAVKDGDGTRLVQTTLGGALGLNPADDVYYAFRDVASGLEYLRAGREICEQGLYVALEAYQYYAFLDFREIRDDGSWGELCRRLEGRPVACLDEDVKEVRYERELGLFREILSEPSPAPEAAPAGRLADFSDALAARCGQPAAAAPFFSAVTADLAASAGLADLAGEGKLGETFPLLVRAAVSLAGREADRRLGLSWLCLRRLGVFGEKEEAAAEVALRFGLGRAAAAWLSAVPDLHDWAPFGLEPGDVPLLVEALLRWEAFFADRAPVRQLFADPAVGRFLRLHESGGVTWFNKERFEFFLERLFAAAVFIAWRKSADREAAEAVARLYETRLDALLEGAAAAGYRADAFLDAGGAREGRAEVEA
jgi:glycosidase